MPIGLSMVTDSGLSSCLAKLMHVTSGKVIKEDRSTARSLGAEGKIAVESSLAESFIVVVCIYS